MRKILHKISIITNVIFAILLILSYLSTLISPEKISFLALLGLSFPFLLLINFIFLIYRIYRKKASLLISLIAILVGYNQISNFLSFSIGNENVKENSLKVMTYNVRMFDIYNWSKNENTSNNILNIIKNEDADVICLQEFYSTKKHNWKKRIFKELKLQDFIVSSKNNKSFFGNAIFSKYPIVNQGFLKNAFPTQKCIYADIKKGNDTIRIYTIHLSSIHLDNDDYKFMKNIKLDIENKDENIEGVKDISTKLLKAYKNRAKEVDAIFPYIEKSPYKTIVCGDFNDTPISYTYQKIKGKLKDSFNEKGFGIGNTYAGSLPLFRIDYVFHSSDISTASFKIIPEELSDHYPVIVNLNL
ncbi:MAG: endonuclease/exonuclease/phosphatase family protein [Chlorobi bacterium]|nr:endonuclease/exonuclease/phosphatase family protein [Chlorobiota bacterium]